MAILPDTKSETRQDFVVSRTTENAEIQTDEHPGYRGIDRTARKHETINHSLDQFVRYDGLKFITTNTAESSFGTLKANILGVYHHHDRHNSPGSRRNHCLFGGFSNFFGPDWHLRLVVSGRGRTSATGAVGVALSIIPLIMARKKRSAEVMSGEGRTMAEITPLLGISDTTCYQSRKEYGGMGTDQTKRMREPEKENGQLKCLVADLSLDNQL